MAFRDVIATGEEYRGDAQEKSITHYRMSDRAKIKHNALGVPLTAATAIVGTTIFATLNSPSQSFWIQVAAGLLSLAAAVIAALQTFFNFAEVAARHKDAAVSYESIRRQLDLFLLSYGPWKDTVTLDPLLVDLRAITQQLDEVARSAPSLPDAAYGAAKARVSERLISPAEPAS